MNPRICWFAICRLKKKKNLLAQTNLCSVHKFIYLLPFPRYHCNLSDLVTMTIFNVSTYRNTVISMTWWPWPFSMFLPNSNTVRSMTWWPWQRWGSRGRPLSCRWWGAWGGCPPPHQAAPAGESAGWWAHQCDPLTKIMDWANFLLIFWVPKHKCTV